MLKGGSYEVGADGVRRLVEGTDQLPDPPPEPKPEQTEPAAERVFLRPKKSEAKE